MAENANSPDSPADREQMRALHFAAMEGDAETVRTLLTAGTRVTPIPEFGGSPLHWAAPLGELEICGLLLAGGTDVNGRDGTERTALLNTANTGGAEVCAFLIANGADVNLKDVGGTTPLHAAANRPDEGICRLLLDNGANVLAVDSDGHTPAQLATSQPSGTLCRLFEQCRPGTSSISVDGGLTPFQYAVARGARAAVQFFVLECGADLDQLSVDGKTMVEVAGADKSMVALLRALRTEASVRLEFEADPSAGFEAAPRRSQLSL